MEYERRFWVQSQVPTGYKASRQKSSRPRAIPECEYDYLKRLRSEGSSLSEISRLMGCSTQTVRTVLGKLGIK